MAPTTLYDTVDVPDELKKFVPDVKVNVFDIAWLTPKQVSMFKSDFRIVADYFVKKRKNQKYKGSTDEMKHIYEVLELLSVMERDDRYKKAYYYKKMEGEIHNMSDVLDRVERMGAEKKEEEVRENVAIKMLAAGKPQSEVVEFSGLSKTRVAQIKRNMAVVQ